MSVRTVPYLGYQAAKETDEPCYHVGSVLDELVDYALSEGCTTDELHERLDEAIERAGLE